MSSGSVEVQHVWPKNPWYRPQPSPELMKGRQTTSFSRKGISLGQPITENGGRYQCNICGKGLCSHRESDDITLKYTNPGYAPIIILSNGVGPTHSKIQVREVHPDLDLEATTLDATRRGRRNSRTATRHRVHLLASHLDSTTGVILALISGDRRY